MNAGAELLELDDGQLAIAADVVERNGQQAFTELARPAEPAPVANELERPADDELQRRARFVVESPYGARTVDGLGHGDELEPEPTPAEDAEPWLDCCKARGSHRRDCSAQRPEQLEDDRTDQERAQGVGGPPLYIGRPPKRSSSRKPARREYACAACSRRLPHEQWVYSRHTGARYCTPGEGCQTPAAYAKSDRARARAQKKEG